MSLNIQRSLQIHHVGVLLRVDLGVWEKNREIINIKLHGFEGSFSSPRTRLTRLEWRPLR